MQFKPVAYEPYGRRRSRGRVPRWLIWLAAGIALGAGGVLLVQERVLPPRLTQQESIELSDRYTRTESERARLASALQDTTRLLDAARTDKKVLTDELDATRNASSTLRADVAALVDALPADPRGGAIEVRAASFSVDRGALAYDVVLTRDYKPGDKPVAGVMQFAVSGVSGRAASSVTLDPVKVSVGLYQSLRGRLPLPEGFNPRQATLRVLDADESKLLGMRILNVNTKK